MRSPAPAARRSRRATRTPHSRRRRRRGRRACRLRISASTARGPRASRPSPAACRDGRRAAPFPRVPLAGDFEEQHRRAARQPHDLAAQALDRLRARHHALRVAITRSMWPFASHCGSKCGDFAGMRMYSVISGTISPSQNSAMAFKICVAPHAPARPRRRRRAGALESACSSGSHSACHCTPTTNCVSSS